MRDVFCQSLLRHAARQEFVFLTGDLGFSALEPLREAMGPRFVNAGVAEQNMMSVAAGLAKTGLKPWAYSIAPFLYARPFEQIRNDICLPGLPVALVGNGGGYGYGVMGSTHHGLEDYGVLLTLPNIRAFIPACDPDVGAVVDLIMETPYPAYLRLGLSELPDNWESPEYAPWRCFGRGGGTTMLVCGPIVGSILAAVAELDEGQRPSIWVVAELPITAPPAEFMADLHRSDHLFVVEEHVTQGGVGQMISLWLLSACRPLPKFTHAAAKGYVTGRYGSQRFHRAECGLDPAAILAELRTQT